VSEIFILSLKVKLTGLDEFKCHHIDISTAIDHGKGHSRVTVMSIACWQKENEEWGEEEHSCTIGNTRCKEDNAIIIKNTFGPDLKEHLKEIRHFGCVAIVDGKVHLGENDGAQQSIPHELWMVGDTLFYSVALGKEGFSTWWYNYCNLKQTNWQEPGHAPGVPWTIERLAEHASKQ
jgi:hypothetical protein